MSRKKLIYGVGINDADYPIRNCCFYKKWKQMLKRCYSEGYQKENPSYTGCSVAEEWLSFMNFRSWMIGKKWQGKQLDKDLLVPGNKIYGSDTCIFIHQFINSLLKGDTVKKRKYPRGVYFNKEKQKYKAYISQYGEFKILGGFDNPSEASAVYKKARSAYIKIVAEKQADHKIKAALFNYAELVYDQPFADTLS